MFLSDPFRQQHILLAANAMICSAPAWLRGHSINSLDPFAHDATRIPIAFAVDRQTVYPGQRTRPGLFVANPRSQWKLPSGKNASAGIPAKDCLEDIRRPENISGAPPVCSRPGQSAAVPTKRFAIASWQPSRYVRRSSLLLTKQDRGRYQFAASWYHFHCGVETHLDTNPGQAPHHLTFSS